MRTALKPGSTDILCIMGVATTRYRIGTASSEEKKR